MHSTSGLIREAALGQLERMDAPALSNVIPTALRDPDPAVRELAIEDICERTQVCGDKSPQDEDNPNDMHHLGSIYASWRAANRR